MSAGHADAGALRRFVRRAAATRPGSWLLARTLRRLDHLVYRLTRSRATFASVVSGLPVVMLTTTGARSGRPATAPLLGVEEGDAVIVVGSNFGRAHHPAWVSNLRKDPRARLAIQGVARDVRAEEVEGADRDRLLALAAEIYPGYPAYAKRAAPRRIAVIRLIPL